MEPRIICAANLFADGTIVLGIRHCDQFMGRQVEAMGMEGYPRAEQGFVDQFGMFYDRQQAWKIAASNGQIIRRCGGDEDGTLFSENLY